MTVCSEGGGIGGRELKRLLAISIEAFRGQVSAINQLNVFPVPDGDTGINMFHTLQRAYQEVAELETDDVSRVLRAFAFGALMGARGNSGTILSQLIKGFAEGLKDAERLSAREFCRACQQAVTMAYASVTQPVEGTILTVAREATESICQDQVKSKNLSAQYAALLRAAGRSLENTPNRLPILKEAGVVDAGATGLVVFLSGLGADGIEPVVTEAQAKPEVSRLSPQATAQESYGYDVQFLMRAADLDLGSIRQDLQRMGWSVLVVGDESLAKVHIHVDNPADPLDYAIRSGAELDDIVVENMQAQYRRQIELREASADSQDAAPKHAGVAVICVAQGAGMREIFSDLGCAQIIAGGQGANPSVEDILEAVRRSPAQEIIILPNNNNILLSARQAAGLAGDKRIGVVPTLSVVQGIAAMLAFADSSDDNVEVEELIGDMSAAAQRVSTIEITRAERAGQLSGIEFKDGECIAILDGKMIAAAATIDTVLLRAFKGMKPRNRELATIYYGEIVSEVEANRLIERLTPVVSDLEFELVYGGQALYPYLIGVE